MTDTELIARVLISDDRGAFGELVQRHHTALRHFLRHLTRGDAATADDLAQETFVLAYRQLTRFRGDARFQTWLFGIAHNQWRNARRRLGRTESLDADTPTRPEPSEPSTVATSDLRHDLDAALVHLSTDERVALHLCFQQGHSHQEIAALLDQPLGTVKTNIARGKERLRSLLAVWNPQP